MENSALLAGAAQNNITPRLGLHLVGWSVRAAGDSIARYVHDDLYVKALVFQQGEHAGAFVVADLVGIDALSAERIRQGIAAQCELDPHAILICATHCHSGPAVGPTAAAVHTADLPLVRADGTMQTNYGTGQMPVASEAYYVGEADPEWKDHFVAQAINTTLEAWRTKRPAEVAFGEAEVTGVGSSRRVLLSDGSWADPRKTQPSQAQVVSRTEIDPLVRVMLVREAESKTILAASINYGSHPWVFSASAYSAEIPGVVAQTLGTRWGSPDGVPAVVLCPSGPAGDVTTIWNVDIKNVWTARPDESQAQSLARREKAFDLELQRLGHRLVSAVETAMAGIESWDAAPIIRAGRREFALPLKPGYRRPDAIVLANWQLVAPAGHHLTEAHLLRVGDGAILAVPGELFVSLGRRLQALSPYRHLQIATLASDFGPFNYMAEPADYELGGYELLLTPAAPEAGDVLVRQSATLFDAD